MALPKFKCLIEMLELEASYSHLKFQVPCIKLCCIMHELVDVPTRKSNIREKNCCLVIQR